MSTLAYAQTQAAGDEAQRAIVFQRRWDAYYGKYRAPLRPAGGGRQDDMVVVNYARIIADKMVAWLFGTPPRRELVAHENTDAERWLEAVWVANREYVLLQKLALNGAVCGHAFVKILPTRPWPRLIVLDPSTVQVFWSPEDIEDVYAYRIQYPAVDEVGRPVVVRQRIERRDGRWEITDERGDGQRFAVVGQTTWPYPFSPIVDCQNLPAANEYWGVSDLEDDLLMLIEAINRTLSNIARILRFHAHPRTWGRGFMANQLQTAVDGTLVLPSPQAELRNLEMTSDLGSSIAFFDQLRQAVHEMACIPEVATGRLDNVGALSGVALSILYRPLLERIQAKRALYGEMLVELNRRLLVLGGYEAQRVTLHWPSLLPVDEVVARQTALMDTQLGVSRDTLLTRLGYDPDIEMQKREREQSTLSQNSSGSQEG